MSLIQRTYIKIISESASFKHSLIEATVKFFSKQNVVLHRCMLDPWLLGSKSKPLLSALDIHYPTTSKEHAQTLHIYRVLSCKGLMSTITVNDHAKTATLL